MLFRLKWRMYKYWVEKETITSRMELAKLIIGVLITILVIVTPLIVILTTGVAVIPSALRINCVQETTYVLDVGLVMKTVHVEKIPMAVNAVRKIKLVRHIRPARYIRPLALQILHVRGIQPLVQLIRPVRRIQPHVLLNRQRIRLVQQIRPLALQNRRQILLAQLIHPVQRIQSLARSILLIESV